MNTMRSLSPRPSATARSAGFSLIEMMIALLLGALVVAGLINILMANRQAYHLQEANNYNQQNMRFAMDRIGWSLRQASFWGAVTPGGVSGSPTVGKVTSSCTQNWVLDVSNPVYGYDGASTFPVGSDCVPSYISGTDVLVVRYAGPDAVPWSASTTPTLNPKQIYLETRAGMAAQLFADTYIKSYPYVSASAPQQGTYIYPYAFEAYYLRPCSNADSSGKCSATSDGGNPIPTLMRMRLDTSGNLITEPVVEGVEQLQFEYGIRDPSGTSPVPIRYEDATTVTSSGDWPNVISVRIGYVLRSATRDTRQTHPFDSQTTDVTNGNYPLRLSGDCQYKVLSDGTASVTSGCTGFSTSSSLGDKPQQYTRIQMTAVVQLRNPIRQI
jgi:prepilin-type N-terminal cleavage/methylation domain-containing protein